MAITKETARMRIGRAMNKREMAKMVAMRRSFVQDCQMPQRRKKIKVNETNCRRSPRLYRCRRSPRLSNKKGVVV